MIIDTANKPRSEAMIMRQISIVLHTLSVFRCYLVPQTGFEPVRPKAEDFKSPVAT